MLDATIELLPILYADEQLEPVLFAATPNPALWDKAIWDRARWDADTKAGIWDASVWDSAVWDQEAVENLEGPELLPILAGDVKIVN